MHSRTVTILWGTGIGEATMTASPNLPFPSLSVWTCAQRRCTQTRSGIPLTGAATTTIADAAKVSVVTLQMQDTFTSEYKKLLNLMLGSTHAPDTEQSSRMLTAGM